MLDFYLDPNTNDIVFEGGDIKVVPSLQELCRQQVVVAINTFKGEWFRNINFGVPWIENEENPVQILGEKDQAVFDSNLRRVISNEPTVLSISKYTTTHDSITGKLTVDVDILSESGLINITTII